MSINKDLYDSAMRIMREIDINVLWRSPHDLTAEYDEVDRTTHSYKSAAGQKDTMIEVNRLFYHMSNDELLRFEKAFKEEMRECNKDDCIYVDLQILQCILHGQKCLRWQDKWFDLETMIDIAKDYRYQVRTGVRLGLTDTFLRERAIEIMHSEVAA